MPLKPVFSCRIALAFAVLSGVLYFLAFPGLGVWPLALIALVPLSVALRGRSPKTAFGLGWLSGFTMTLAGFYWLLDMLRVFSGFSTAFCLLFMVLVCAYQSGRMGVLGFLYARAEARGWPTDVAFLLAFATSEYAYPLLFPWYFGATVHTIPVLLQTADLGGAIFVSLVLAVINLIFVECLLARLEGRPLRRRALGGLGALVLGAVLYGTLRIAQLDRIVAEAPKVTVGLVQANLSLKGKRHDFDEGLERHLRLTQKLRKSRPLDLVIWSETSVMRAVNESTLVKSVPQDISRQLSIPAIFGAVIVKPVAGPRKYVAYNSALATAKDGTVTGRYDKHFLVLFSESIPFGDTFPILYDWSPNSGRFSPGDGFEPLRVADHDVMTLICYEDLSPSFVNRMFRHKNAQLLVNLTNDAWFGDTMEPYQHLALAQLRAVEQRRFFVRSTNSGVSAFVDPVGRTLSQTRTFTEATLTERVAWLDGSTVYRRIGDVPYWLMTAASLCMAFARRNR